MSDASNLLWAAYSELSAIRHGRPMSDVFKVDQLLGRLMKAANERDASLTSHEFAKIVPVGHAYTVAIGSLGIKILNTMEGAQEVCDAINENISAELNTRALDASKEVESDPDNFNVGIYIDQD